MSEQKIEVKGHIGVYFSNDADCARAIDVMGGSGAIFAERGVAVTREQLARLEGTGIKIYSSSGEEVNLRKILDS